MEYHNRPTDTKRERRLESWEVQGYPAHDPSITIYRLVGIVVEDSEQDFRPSEFIRITKTSPIKSIEGDVVTTATGSTYKLGRPIQAWINQGYDELVPLVFQNLWLEGDNWLTI